MAIKENYTILIVDDTSENLTMLSGVLKGNYKVKAAKNGETALKICFSESPPDLILLDIMMPEMDGYEVCRRLKERTETKDIPVIFLTAMVDMDDEVRGLEIGALDYVIKPINPPILMARLKAQLQILTEKNKTELLLRNVLPVAVAEELRLTGRTKPVTFEKAAVLFSDLVGFTKISSTMTAKVLIDELNDIFTAYDTIIEKNKCERIKTIGDAYMAVSGMPIHTEWYADNIIWSAIEVLTYLKERKSRAAYPWSATIGIASGEVVGGIVGVKKYIYDIFGSTVNMASRLQSATKVFQSEILISGTLYKDIRRPGDFCVREIDTVRVRGIEEPVTLYEIYDCDEEKIRNQKKENQESFLCGMALYKKGQFREALELFEECEKKCPGDPIPSVYIKRCSTLARLPVPPDWQGISGI